MCPQRQKSLSPGGVFRAELGVPNAAFKDDARNVDQRFHVVNDGGLSEKSGLVGNGGLLRGSPR